MCKTILYFLECDRVYKRWVKDIFMTTNQCWSKIKNMKITSCELTRLLYQILLISVKRNTFDHFPCEKSSTHLKKQANLVFFTKIYIHCPRRANFLLVSWLETFCVKEQWIDRNKTLKLYLVSIYLLYK